MHLVRGLAAPNSRLELPCLVDQTNCGEVYYITWTRQAAGQQSADSTQPITSGLSSSQIPWTRVYLYTGANDSAPHKPIGDLVNRATFLMPDRATPNGPAPNNQAENDNNQDTDSELSASASSELAGAGGATPERPTARLIIEEPKLSDEALYKCDVTYVKGKCPSISLVRVQMMSLPSKAQIYLVNGANQQRQDNTVDQEAVPDGQLIGPFNERDQLQLKCLVSGGRPAPKAVFWRKIDSTGRIVNLLKSPPATQVHQHQSSRGASGSTSGQTTTSSAGGPVEVVLNYTLTSVDLGAKFECHIEHEAIERPSARLVVGQNELDAGGRTPIEGPVDAMLDLHPSRSQVEPAANNLARPLPPVSSKSLDSHVVIDLNGKLI